MAYADRWAEGLGGMCNPGVPARSDAHAASAAPASGHIAFVRGNSIWTVQTDGTHAKRLTHLKGEVGSPAWSSDGKTIAYARTTKRKGRYTATVWVMSARGGHTHRLVFREPVAGWHRYIIDSLVYSPNGRYLAIGDRASKGGSDRERVVLVNLKTHRSGVVYKISADLDGIEVSFSSDSQWVLMNVMPSDVSNGAIKIVKTSTRKVTSLAQGGLGATFSPDGTRIVFERVWEDSNYEPHSTLATMSSTGATPTDVFTPAGQGLFTDGPIVWDAKSSQVAFEMDGNADVLDLSTLVLTEVTKNAYELAWQR